MSIIKIGEKEYPFEATEPCQNCCDRHGENEFGEIETCSKHKYSLENCPFCYGTCQVPKEVNLFPTIT